MRRYTLNISDREFVVDVQEIDSDTFEVFVGGERYQVGLAGEEGLSGAAPASDAAPVARPVAAPMPAAKPPAAPAAKSPVARPPAGGGGGKGAQTAPMPGVILEVNVKAGDSVTRGQQVAILDAMKMHNVIGAARAGTVDEVYVTAGQSVDHGTPLLKYREDQS
ncbi:MAG: biotin/lipoyl-binding protein [Candidatus Accumulibacter sp.]|nr:biotin/lipoyl-binding protein [Accumulibacter sp.]